MSEPLTPATPIHPAPDTEVTLPEEGFIADELDLNPDLDDEEDEASSLNRRQETENGNTTRQLHQYSYRDSSESNFTLWTLPFHQALEELVTELGSRPDHEHLNLSQESKLITYLDEKLLRVQRNFIKNQADSDEKYPLQQLLNDIKAIADLIWYSIDLKTPLFGQEEYFIRILGDLEDWVSYYEIPVLDPKDPELVATYKTIFQFFQCLDTRVSFLIDGYQINEIHMKLSVTELVRLGPIVNRVRIEIVDKMEKSRAHLSRQIQSNDSTSTAYMNILEIEVGRLMEGIIERL